MKMEQKKKSSTSSCKLSRGDQEGKGEKPGDCHNCAVSMSAVIAVATVVIEGELIKREKSKTLHRGIQEKKILIGKAVNVTDCLVYGLSLSLSLSLSPKHTKQMFGA